MAMLHQPMPRRTPSVEYWQQQRPQQPLGGNRQPAVGEYKGVMCGNSSFSMVLTVTRMFCQG
jgi:hypothetical protein